MSIRKLRQDYLQLEVTPTSAPLERGGMGGVGEYVIVLSGVTHSDVSLLLMIAPNTWGMLMLLGFQLPCL